MFREDFIDYLYRKYLIRKRYFENTAIYLSTMKEACKALDPNCRVVLFGSYVRGTVRPDSDIDVLLISELARDPWIRAKLYVKILENLDPEHPFELHIATPEEYEKWYKKFIDVFIEV